MAPRQRFRPVPLGPHHVVCDTCARSRPRTDFKIITQRPRCDDCRRTMKARFQSARWLQRTLDAKGIEVKVANRARDVRVSQRPDEAGLNDHAEPLAAAGIVMVLDRTGVPVLPIQPTAALRTAYRALIPLHPTNGEAEGRLGPLCNDRTYLLGIISKLAKQPGVHPKLAAQAENVRDLALLHEGGLEANDALGRLLGRFRKMFYKHALAKWKLGLMTKEEAEARLDAGILIGLLKWTPLHPKMAKPGSVVGWWAPRELQIRTRADRAIGVMPIYDDEKERKKGAKPKVVGYTKAAVSYDALSAGNSYDDGTFTPIMSKVSADESHCGQRRNNKPTTPVPSDDAASALATDLDAAFAMLDADDAAMLRAHLVERKSITKIAAAQGMTESEARRRIRAAQAAMRDHLSDYN